MYADRLSRLQAVLLDNEVSCLAAIPGPNLRYLTGLNFHLMERPVVAFFPAEDTPELVLPALEMAKFDDGGPFEMALFPYTDEDGPEDAFLGAARELSDVHQLAVEFLVMRVQELRLVQRRVPNAIIRPAEPLMDALRLTKDAAEVDAMRRAIEITEDALAAVVATVEPGQTEKSIAERLRIEMIQRGGGPLPFEPIVLAGARAALPHGEPSDAVVEAGQVLLIDFGTTVEGYASDITRTFVIGGELSAAHKAAYEAVLAANRAGREAAKPGVTAQEVDRAARQAIVDAGLGEYFVHRTGHGLGLDCHERPYIVEGDATVLEPGMTFTVEPGVYLPDDIGVRIEDDLLITADGVESLTTYPREIGS
jgi:Xaa-Pro dipeptidase